MSKFSNRILAVTAGLCLISSAASAEGMRISYKGLDLARPADAAIFKARVDKTAQAFCNAYVASNLDLGARSTCEQAIFDEVDAKLPDVQRQAFAHGRETAREIVSAQR